MRAIQRFGKQLQQLRTRRGLTQEQLAVTGKIDARGEVMPAPVVG